MSKIIITVVAVIIVILGGLVLWHPSASSTQQVATPATSDPIVPITNPAATPTASTTTPATPGTYTLADVAKHPNKTSCWAAINGSVYDLTKWISQHPGGPDRILSICGKDGSSAFNGQHSGDTKPAAMLATFKIGALVQ
ncbi:MAG: uncharacterized protein JWO43_36 [Candidatus Adlerbacteria bacterium]|nr:uncharacterized protein [Candidatus Adlerbacteria bacterium]